MEKKALGKGLDALFEPSAGSEIPSRSLEIEIDRIIPNRYQPRKEFEENRLNGLAESVRHSGILQPVVLRRLPDGRFELIAGERRWRAARVAGLKKIPAMIKEASDEDLLALALVENIQRQDLNSIDAARGYRRLIKDFQMTQEEIALRIGKDRSSVANALRLLLLPVEIQDEIKVGRLSAGHAKALLALARSLDQTRVARQIIQKGWSVRQAERWVKQLRDARPKKKAEARRLVGLYEAEDRLRKHLGTAVRITPKAKGGTVTIQYHDVPDLDRVMDLILSKSH